MNFDNILARTPVNKTAKLVINQCGCDSLLQLYGLVDERMQLKLNVKKLVVVSFLARGARFFLVSILLFFYGDQARELILSSLDRIIIIVVIAVIIGFVIWRLVLHRIVNRMPR